MGLKVGLLWLLQKHVRLGVLVAILECSYSDTCFDILSDNALFLYSQVHPCFSYMGAMYVYCAHRHTGGRFPSAGTIDVSKSLLPILSDTLDLVYPDFSAIGCVS